MAKEKYYARRSFRYGDEKLSRGQIFELRGFINDEKLVRLGYCELLPAKHDTFECRGCGGKFIDGVTRDAHYRAEHETDALTAAEEDERAERREQRENEIAPLYLAKTSASKGVTAAR